jgi:SAGA-associated factor 73
MSLQPLSAKLDYSLCSHCRKPFLNKALPYHIQYSCPVLKNEEENNSSNSKTTATTPTKSKSADTSATTSFANSSAATPSPRKRELEQDGTSATPVVKKPRKPYTKRKLVESTTANTSDSTSALKKDKKERLKVSTAKPKGPVDVERQCGVPLPNGQLCARSLTCKSHSMGAKRAVPGRSVPYDVLLANYQKKNQVKLASMTTQQQLADENEALMGSTPVNPEEEFQQVMEGVKRACAYPLEKKVLFPIRLKDQLFRMREMLASSLLPKGLSASSGLGGIFGRANAFNPDNPDNLHFFRPPSAQRTAYLQSLKQQQLRQAQTEARATHQTIGQDGQQ